LKDGSTEALVLSSAIVKPSTSATSLSRSCTSTSGTRLPLRPTGFSFYASPALFANPAVSSATGARLDTGGWLTLTRQGLSPCKICRAYPGALTKNSPARGRTMALPRNFRFSARLLRVWWS